MENQGQRYRLGKENFPQHLEKMIYDIKNDEDFQDIVLITLILAAFSPRKEK